MVNKMPAEILCRFQRYNSMSLKLRIGIPAAVVTALVFFACSKYEDPPPAPLPEELTRHYCNDSRAINYNRGFPGIADNTVCIFPTDPFNGSWIFYDTLYLPSGDTAATLVKNLVFTPTEDTARTHLAVTGWCSSNQALYVTANKFFRAETDTLPGGFPQYLCNAADTLYGSFSKADTTEEMHYIKVDLTVNTASGVIYHRGTAARQ